MLRRCVLLLAVLAVATGAGSGAELDSDLTELGSVYLRHPF